MNEIKLRPYQQAVVDVLRGDAAILREAPQRFFYSAAAIRWAKSARIQLKPKPSIYSSAAQYVHELPPVNRLCYNVRRAVSLWSSK